MLPLRPQPSTTKASRQQLTAYTHNKVLRIKSKHNRHSHTHTLGARARNPERVKLDALQVQSMCHSFKRWTWTPPLSKHMLGNGPWPCSCSWRETLYEKHGCLHCSFWSFFSTLLHLFRKRQKGHLHSQTIIQETANKWMLGQPDGFYYPQSQDKNEEGKQTRQRKKRWAEPPLPLRPWG